MTDTHTISHSHTHCQSFVWSWCIFHHLLCPAPARSMRKTRKSSYVNARGIPTAAYQVLHLLPKVGYPQQGYPRPGLTGGYPRRSTPWPGLTGGTQGGVPPGQVWVGGTRGRVPPSLNSESIPEVGYPPARSDRVGYPPARSDRGVPPSQVWQGVPEVGYPQLGLMGCTQGGVPPARSDRGVP